MYIYIYIYICKYVCFVKYCKILVLILPVWGWASTSTRLLLILDWSSPGGSDSKKSACNAEDLDLIPGSGRSLGKGMEPSPVFLPGESHGQRRLEGHSPWVPKESHLTE